MRGGAGSRSRRPSLRLVPLPHAARAASSIPGGAAHATAAPGSAFPRTSVGFAAAYFQFLLRAGAAGSSWGFRARCLQRPPPPRTCVLPRRFLCTWVTAAGGGRRRRAEGGLRGQSGSWRDTWQMTSHRLGSVRPLRSRPRGAHSTGCRRVRPRKRHRCRASAGLVRAARRGRRSS